MLTEINFICQFLGLANAIRIGPPPREAAGAVKFFQSHSALSRNNADILLAANDIFEAVLQVGRAATGGVFEAASAGATLKARMASLCGVQTIDEAEIKLAHHQSEVAQIYRSVINSM